jgi:hypothetical protein
MNKNISKTVVTMIIATLIAFPALANGPADIETEADLFLPLVPTNMQLDDFALVRNDSSLNVKVKLSGLEKQSTYTMWWLIEDFDEEGNITGFLVLNASGGVVGGRGNLTMAAHLGAGSFEAGALHPSQVLFPEIPEQEIFGTLAAPRTANVMLVIVDHGPKIPGLVSEQIHYIEGACPINFPSAGVCPDTALIFSCATPGGPFTGC